MGVYFHNLHIVIYVLCVYPLHRLYKHQTPAEVFNVNFALLKDMENFKFENN